MSILIDHEYYVVELHRPIDGTVANWLVTHFGPCDGTRWWYKNYKIYFADSKDHMMFILRWS